MIRFWVVRLMVGKELLEVLRDRRAMFLTIILPLLMYPLFFLATTQLAATTVQAIEAEEVQVAVVSERIPDALFGLVQPEEHLIFERMEANAASEGFARGDIAVILTLPEWTGEPLPDSSVISASLAFDSTRETSQRAKRQVERILAAWSDRIVGERLERLQLSDTFTSPLHVEPQNMAPPVKVGGHLLGTIVPMLIVLMIGLGAFHPAVEVTAGEKERGTLQTLLSAPLLPIEIVAGKFVGVLIMALLAGVSNLLSLVLLGGLAAAMPLPDDVLRDISLALSFEQVAALVWLTLLTALFFSALMMTVAVLARSYREAQAYTTPVYFMCVLPAMFAQLPGMDPSGPLAFVPGIGQALVMKAVLNDTAGLELIAQATVATTIFTGGILILAAKIFENEAVMFGETGLTGIIPQRRDEGGGVPRPSDTLAFAAVVAVLYIYLGSALQMSGPGDEGAGLLVGLTLSQWCILGSPCFLWLRWRRYDVARSLGLRLPSARYLAAALFLGLTAWYPASLLASLFQSPGSSEAAQQLASQLFPEDASFLWVFFVVAVTPAVCEELLVRGVILRAFERQFRVRTVAIATGVMFGAFHMSVSKFVPLTAMGVMMGYLALRSGSLLPGVLFHLLNNGMAVVLSLSPPNIPGLTEEDGFHWLPATLSLLGLAVGGRLLCCAAQSNDEPESEASTPT